MMECVVPPELNESQLLAYIDGETGPEVAAHLVLCPACRERAGRLGRLIGRITVMLYRLDCPPATDLGEYQLGLLPDAQAGAITAHLGECQHCRAELGRLQRFMADMASDLEPSLIGRARVLVARLLGGASMPGPVPSMTMAGVRGGDAPLVYEAGDLQITLTVEPSEQEPDRWDIFGLVIGVELAGARVELWDNLRLGGETTINAPADFMIAGIVAATYELVIAGPDVEVHLEDVRVG